MRKNAEQDKDPGGEVAEQEDGDINREHDQDSDPPRTAVPPGSSETPGQPPASSDPDRDPDSDPPRTPVV